MIDLRARLGTKFAYQCIFCTAHHIIQAAASFAAEAAASTAQAKGTAADQPPSAGQVHQQLIFFSSNDVSHTGKTEFMNNQALVKICKNMQIIQKYVKHMDGSFKHLLMKYDLQNM